jgi:hypothetical protein
MFALFLASSLAAGAAVAIPRPGAESFSGFYVRQPVYGKDLGATFTEGPKTFKKLPGAAFRYECVKGCGDTVKRDIIIRQGDGRTVQRVEWKDGTVKNGIYDASGALLGHLATDDLTAKRQEPQLSRARALLGISGLSLLR